MLLCRQIKRDSKIREAMFCFVPKRLFIPNRNVQAPASTIPTRAARRDADGDREGDTYCMRSSGFRGSADPHAAEDFSFRARRSHVQPNVRAARSSRNACPCRAGQYRRPASLRAFVTGPQVQSFVLFPFNALCTLRCIRTNNCRSIRDHQTCCPSARVPGAEHVARRLSGSLEAGPLSMAPNLRYALRT